MKLKGRITSFFSVLLLAALLLAGCTPVVDNSGAAYLEVSKELYWKSVYQVGDSVSLNGLTAKYFPNTVESDDFEEVTLTESMISGFNTSKEGSFTMTVTYKGKTATVGYTVIPKVTPLEINVAFVIKENTVAAIDTATSTVTISVFDNYFKALANQPSSTVAKPLSNTVNSQGEAGVTFEHNGSTYTVRRDSESSTYFIKTSTVSGSAASSVVEQIAHPISLGTLKAPQKNVAYKSELKDGSYYSIKLDDSYNAVVTKHTVEGDTTVDTVVDNFTASNALLITGGLLRYSLYKDGFTATAAFSSQSQFKIRKVADNALESVYSVVCYPEA